MAGPPSVRRAGYPEQHPRELLALGRRQRGEQLVVGGSGRLLAALEQVGGELLTPALAALAPEGRLVAYSSGGGTVRAYDLLAGAKSVIGFQTARIARGKPEVYEQWREELWRLRAAGELTPVVHGEFALEDAAKAHGEIERRANLGKVVLIP